MELTNIDLISRHYLKQNQISSYIKLQDHEKRKTRAYAQDIGKYYNMTFQMFENEKYYSEKNYGRMGIAIEKIIKHYPVRQISC